jgi:DNA-directed RNA polymerase specialized sigma24 family protein
MNAQVAAYADACDALASRLARGARARQVGAEFDDLYQEGLILVWQSLERGIAPSTAMILNRMRDWMRYLGRQNPVPYEAMLPLEDFSGTAAR